MPSTAKELDNRKDGDRGSCRVCNPADPTRYVSADRLWHWSLEEWDRTKGSVHALLG